MAYVGETPWHKLGVKLPETCTWADVRDAVKFPTVLEVPVYAHGRPSPVVGYKALKASDDGRILSIVGADYGVVQADDMAAAVMEAGRVFGVKWATAGVLGANGDRFFMTGQLGEFQVRGDVSPIRKFFGMFGGHDGQTTVKLRNINERVVCANTEAIALSEKDNWRMNIRHTSRAADRVKEAGAAFAAMCEEMKAKEALFNALASVQFDAVNMDYALDKVLPLPEKGEEARNYDRVMADRAKVAELSEIGKGMEGIRGTAWGAFNAFTEWADHFRAQRAQAELDALQARALNLTFGPAAEVKAAALDAIRSIVRV